MDQLTLYAEDSLAKTSASLERVQDSQEPEVVSGTSTSGSLKKRSRSTQSSRTSQPFALEDWTRCSGASLRSGMTRNGTVFPLPTLGPGTRGTASGFLPTPTASADAKGAPKDRYWGSRTYRGLLREALRSGPDDPIYPHPTFVEKMMGFPIGHTDLSNSGTP